MWPRQEPSLVERIERLEAENRRLRRAGQLLVAGVLALTVLGMADRSGRNVLEATEFRLVDEEGELRASLGLPDRRAQLRFFRDGFTLLRVGPEHVALGGWERGIPRLVLAPEGFRGSSRWSGADTDHPDAQASLWLPTDDLSHGPLLSLSHGERGSLALGYGLHGELLLALDGRRVYLDDEGYVRWEPDPRR